MKKSVLAAVVLGAGGLVSCSGVPTTNAVPTPDGVPEVNLFDQALGQAISQTFGDATAKKITSANVNGLTGSGPLSSLRFTLANVGRTEAEFGRAFLQAEKAFDIKSESAQVRMEDLDALYASPIAGVLSSKSSESYDDRTKAIRAKLEEVRAGEFELNEEAKGELKEAQKSFTRGSTYHVFAALAMRSLSDQMNESGLKTLAGEVARDPESPISEDEVQQVPTTLPQWLVNTKDVVSLLVELNAVTDVSGINEAELELAEQEAQAGVNELAANEGLSTPSLP